MFETSISKRRLRTLIAALALPILVAACENPEERVQSHYESGVALFEEGSIEKATLEFRNALSINQDHAPSHYVMGQISEQRGDLQNAFNRYRRVLEIEPENFDARVKVGRFYVLGEQLEQAEESLVRAREVRPEDLETFVLEAAIALRQDDMPKMRAALDRVFAEEPDHVDAALLDVNYLLKTATDEEALVRANAALTLAPENSLLHTVKLQILQRLGDQEGMGAQLATMVELFPEELRLRENYARWAIISGEVDIAEAQLRELATQQPKKTEAAFDLVRYIRAQRGVEAGRAELNRMIAEAEDPFPLRLMLAQFENDTGDPDTAYAMLREMIQTDDRDNANRARVALARTLIRNGDQEAGIKVVEDAINADSKEVEALVLWSAHLVENDRLDEATGYVRLGLNEAPEDIRLLLLSGQLQERLGNIDLASDRMAKAVRLQNYEPRIVQPYVQFLNRVGRLSAAETVLSETFRRYPNDEQVLDQLGFIRAKMEDWNGAEEVARYLAQTNPDRARQLRAAILIGQEKFDEGASLLEDLPEDERQRAASIAALVQTYIQNGEPQRAADFLDDLLEENPDNLQALGLRGNLYLAEGNRELALQYYEQVLELDPGNAGAQSAISRVYLMDGEDGAAELALLEGLALDPDNLFLKTRLAQFRELQGDFESAIDLYGDVYQQVPNSLLITNNLASLLADHKLDDGEAVERAYQMAGRLRDSPFPHYRDTYGWTRYLRGEYEEALAYVEPVADALPQNAYVHYHLGMIYAALKRFEEARTHLDRSLTLSRDLPFPPREAVEAKIEEIDNT